MSQPKHFYLQKQNDRYLFNDTSKMPQINQEKNSRSKEKKIYYKNDHQQQQYFSIQRDLHQPSRHFSPERQQLELPIVKNGNIGESKQKRLNEFKNVLNQTRKFRNGSLYDNYYQMIQQVKKRHQFNEDDREVEDFTYQTSECNRNKLLANAMFNIATPQTELNHINQQTFFNLDMHLWNSKQKQNLNNSQFALTPLNNLPLNPLNNKKYTRSRNLSLPPTAGARLSDVSSILNKTYLNSNFSSVQQSIVKSNTTSRKHKTQQPSLSPIKGSIFDDNLGLNESSVSQPKKKILEINFATGMGKKYLQNDEGRHQYQIIKTPYIDKAIQIIEEKQKLDEDDDEQSVKFVLREDENNKKNNIESEKDGFIKIDGGFGDYILRYHHIKQRLQKKLIPEKVAMPELSNLFTTYDELETEIQRSKEIIPQNEATPLPQPSKRKQQQ